MELTALSRRAFLSHASGLATLAAATVSVGCGPTAPRPVQRRVRARRQQRRIGGGGRRADGTAGDRGRHRRIDPRAASWCGICGLRPTYARYPDGGIMPLTQDKLDQVGAGRSTFFAPCGGHPGLVLPAGVSTDGLPIGIEFDSLPGTDR
jgi:hypothetical protein